MAGDFAEFSNDTLGRSKVYSEAYFGTESRDIAGEYTLPDYLPDIAKILSVRAVPTLGNKSAGDGTMEWQGEVHYNVVYVTTDGAPASAVFAEPFSGGAAVESLTGDCIAELIPGVDQVSVKPINARRVGLKSRVTVRGTVLCEKSVDTEVQGKQTIEDGFNLEYLKETVKNLEIKTGSARDVMISEDVELDSGLPSVKDIVSCSVTVLLPEVRPRADEADVSADLMLDLVFESEDGDYSVMHKRLRMSETVAVPGLKPEYECTARVEAGILKASAQNNSYGERRIIELDFPCDIEVTGYHSREISVIADMYSTACGLDTVKDTVETAIFKRAYTANVSVNASSEKEGAGLAAARSIIDGSVVLEDTEFTYLPDKRKIMTEGTAVVTVIATGEENSKAYYTGSFKFPYKIAIDSSEEGENLRLMGKTVILAQRYRMDASNVYGDIEVGVQITAFEKEKHEYVSAAILDKSNAAETRCSGFTLYYPEEGETLWEIAKKYQISRKSIEDANGGRESGVILIPNKHTFTPAFSKMV